MQAAPYAPRMRQTAGPLSHDRHWHPAVVQAVSAPGTVDLGPGYLEPALLPVDLLRDAYAAALAEFGSAALSYGNNAGARVLRELIAARVADRHGGECGADQVLVTAGTSQALQLLSTTMAAPGEVVLLDRSAYDFGQRIFTDHGLRLRTVPGDPDGMHPQALDEALAAERRAGRRTAFLYLNPTFHNPTGILVSSRRRRELIEVAARHDVLIVEDDAYGELGLDGPPPSPLAVLAGHRRVVRLGSFAKTLGPGLRLGWLQADAAVVTMLAARGLLLSGGSLNHVTSLAVAVLIRDGRYDRHLDWLRGQLRSRRDRLTGALRETLGDHITFDDPAGGFFLWLRLPDTVREEEALTAAAAARVVVAAGSRFGSAGRPAVRLTYSFNSPDRLALAANRLASAWTRLDAHP
jgi:enduracididine biosynthesis enzyme MppQ